MFNENVNVFYFVFYNIEAVYLNLVDILTTNYLRQNEGDLKIYSSFSDKSNRFARINNFKKRFIQSFTSNIFPFLFIWFLPFILIFQTTEKSHQILELIQFNGLTKFKVLIFNNIFYMTYYHLYHIVIYLMCYLIIGFDSFTQTSFLLWNLILLFWLLQ